MSRPAVSCVKWVDFSDHMLSTFLDVYVNALYSDVTLVLSDGSQLTACRMILSMASKFFEDIFRTAYSSLGVSWTGLNGVGELQDVRIMIPDVSFAVMKHVLHFIYTGEVHLNARDMAEFFEACQLFRLKGLDYQNGNVNGVKISGSNIITPEQYDYDEEALQEAYAGEESTPMPETVADAAAKTTTTTSAEVEATVALEEDSEATGIEEHTMVLEETSDLNETDDVQKTAAGTESVPMCQIHQYYEVEMSMEDLEPSTSSQDSKTHILRSLKINRDDPLMTTTTTTTTTIQAQLSGSEDNETSMDESGESSGLSKKRLKHCEYGERLEEAVNSIVKGGSSFRTASIQYGIPKTVLWRKAVQVPNYKAERCELSSPRKEAIEALKSGEKLLNISKRFDIPLSTLHRDKLKLYTEGALPENVSLKQRDKGIDFKDRVLEAAQQCLSSVMTQSEAAKYYKLPKTTIWRKIKALKEEENGKREAMEAELSSEMEMKPELVEVLESNEDDADYVVMV